MILDDIKNKLKEIDPNVFYGAVDNSMRETIWDYTVFNRTRRKDGVNRTGNSRYYMVHVVREHFIPEDLEDVIIAKMLEIPGMRRTDEDAAYTQVVKPNTDIVVEMVSIPFMVARKS